MIRHNKISSIHFLRASSFAVMPRELARYISVIGAGFPSYRIARKSIDGAHTPLPFATAISVADSPKEHNSEGAKNIPRLHRRNLIRSIYRREFSREPSISRSTRCLLDNAARYVHLLKCNINATVMPRNRYRPASTAKICDFHGALIPKRIKTIIKMSLEISTCNCF